MSDPADLDGEAARFAAELTATVRALVPDCAEFIVDSSTARHGTERVSVRQNPETGIPLTVRGEPLINLKVSYYCSLDRDRQYLAVERSEVVVRAAGASQPLIRFDFLRRPASTDIPHAHIQVHAHSEVFGYIMAKAGVATTRGRRRAESTRIPQLSELHLPVGGPRFRPCLEDVLEILVHEFGIDSTDEGLEALRAGRERWRRKQIATVVREAPEVAAGALRRLGYTLTPPRDGPPPDDMKRLRAL